MRTHLVLLAGLLAGCPDQTGQECPANTTLMGQYTLAFTGVDAGTQCVASTDAGPVYLTATNPGSKGATLCLGMDGGEPELNLLVAGKSGVYRDAIGSDGKFHFASDQPVTATGTACSCDVSDTQTFEGTLIGGASDGGFALLSDGGVPPIDGLSGTTVDTITSAAAGQSCLCAFPCTVTYAIKGTRY